MRLTHAIACVAFVFSAGTALDAQWINLPTPGLPRLADGKANLTATARARRTANPTCLDCGETTAGIATTTTSLPTCNRATSLPAYLTTRYRMSRIVQTPTLIMMAFDDGMHREIFMDGRALEPDPNPTWMGYSVGRWDGDVLVVESNGYTDRSWLDFGGHPHTEELRIIERYTRRDVGHIDLQVEMIDAKVYTKPITFSMPMLLQADTEMLEGVCENHHKSRERMASTKPAEVVHVDSATLSRYIGTYDIDEDGTKHATKATLEDEVLWFVEFSTGADGTINMLLRYVESDARGTRRK